MQLHYDGTPIIATPDDQRTTDRFIDKLVERVYDRLPWYVRRFISKARLIELLRGEVISLAQGL